MLYVVVLRMSFLCENNTKRQLDKLKKGKMSTELNNDYAQPFDALTDILSHVVVGNKNLVVSDGSGSLKPGIKALWKWAQCKLNAFFILFFIFA